MAPDSGSDAEMADYARESGTDFSDDVDPGQTLMPRHVHNKGPVSK